MTPEKALSRYVSDYQVDGVAYTRHDKGMYWTDDDNALYTGIMLGAMSYRFAAHPEKGLDEVKRCLRGTWLLITATGTPGVLVRRAFPAELEASFGMPLYAEQDRVVELRDGYYYQLKTTRDQITGVLFGLACARAFVYGHDPVVDESIRYQIAQLYKAIKARKWSVSDHRFRAHGTSAHKLDAPLRLLLKALAHSVGELDSVPSEQWFYFVKLFTLHYNTRIQNAYSHGLNAMCAHALWLLRGHHKHYRAVKEWMSIIDGVVAEERNPFWELLLTFQLTPAARFRMDDSGDDPYTRFFKWNKYSKELSARINTSGPMIDYMVCAYMSEKWDYES